MRVDPKQRSSVNMRMSGIEPGVGGVNTGGSGGTKVGSVDVVSRIVMWVNSTAQKRV